MELRGDKLHPMAQLFWELGGVKKRSGVKVRIERAAAYS